MQDLDADYCKPYWTDRLNSQLWRQLCQLLKIRRCDAGPWRRSWLALPKWSRQVSAIRQHTSTHDLSIVCRSRTLMPIMVSLAGLITSSVSYPKTTHDLSILCRTLMLIMASLAELIASSASYADNYSWFVFLMQDHDADHGQLCRQLLMICLSYAGPWCRSWPAMQTTTHDLSILCRTLMPIMASYADNYSWFVFLMQDSDADHGQLGRQLLMICILINK